MPTTQQVIDLYRRRAKRYDLTAHLYYLLGFREVAARKRAVRALQLSRGDTVVEIGCGTGLNFKYLHRAVGESGRIIGVDVTDAMLEQARDRVAREGWTNIELVHGDATEFEFPDEVTGVLSTFAITLIADYDLVIERAARALVPNGRVAICDLKLPEGKMAKLAPYAMPLVRPFGVTLALGDRRPWESVERYFQRSTMREFFGGIIYLVVGEMPKHPIME